MANYFTYSVVNPVIPERSMTKLEREILSLVFEARQDPDGVYFVTQENLNDMPEFSRSDLEQFLAEDTAGLEVNAARKIAREALEKNADEDYITLNFSATDHRCPVPTVKGSFIRHSKECQKPGIV